VYLASVLNELIGSQMNLSMLVSQSDNQWQLHSERLRSQNAKGIIMKL